MHQKQLSCAVFADSKTLITAGLDCTVAVWTMTTGAKAVDLQPKTTLFGNMAPVTIIATSKSYNALLCVTAQGQASLWDLNRLKFVRNLPSQDAVEVGSIFPCSIDIFPKAELCHPKKKCARINDVNGDIVLCHRQSVVMYTLNGQHILTQQVCGTNDDDDDKDDCISSCAFYEGVGNEWLERELLFTGLKRGVVNVIRPLFPTRSTSENPIIPSGQRALTRHSDLGKNRRRQGRRLFQVAPRQTARPHLRRAAAGASGTSVSTSVSTSTIGTGTAFFFVDAVVVHFHTSATTLASGFPISVTSIPQRRRPKWWRWPCRRRSRDNVE